MKRIILTVLATLGMWLSLTASSNAGVRFGIYVGGPGYYCPRPCYYGPGWGCYYPTCYYGWHRHHGHHWH